MAGGEQEIRQRHAPSGRELDEHVIHQPHNESQAELEKQAEEACAAEAPVEEQNGPRLSSRENVRKQAQEGVLAGILRTQADQPLEALREERNGALAGDDCSDEKSQLVMPLGPVDRHQEKAIGAPHELARPLARQQQLVDTHVAQQAIESVDRAIEARAEPARDRGSDSEGPRLPGHSDGGDHQADRLPMPLADRT